MKKVTLVLLAVLFLATLALAGDETPKTKEGDKAMLFSFSGLSNLGAGSYMGGVGAKYYFQDDMALRFGLGFGYNGSTTKGTNGSPDLKNNTLTFSVDPALIYNLTTSGPIVAYVGGAVDFSLYGHTVESSNKVVTTTANFGLGGLAGFEWFPWSNISLGAEYGLMLNFGSGSTETTNSGVATKVDAPSSTSIGLGSNGGITLGVWF